VKDSADNPKTRNITTNPPLWNINGGTYHKGRVYVVTNGSPTRAIYTIDPLTGATLPVLNNFRGSHLNSPNDIIIDSESNIWFTDPAYGWYSAWPGVGPPELPNSIYFFNSTSRALICASNNVVLTPNGLALSADEKTLYVSDSNTTAGRPAQTHASSIRNIWAFDVNGALLSNPRLIYETETGWPDGLRVTRNGFLMIAVVGGVDVVDPRNGMLVGKINTRGDVVYNLESIPGTGMWILTGRDGIYKVGLKERGLDRI
jgi:sugar lactone lactonase YvrE